MPGLKDLLNNVSNFKYYYGGYGNFTQKSLKYGNDRQGGGDSGQPYIKRKEGEQWSPGNFDDGLVRGGTITSVTRSAADVLRIGKFLTDLPKGTSFIAKQVGLQLSNPKLESPVGDNSFAPQNLDLRIRGNGILNPSNSAVNVVNVATRTVQSLADQIGPTRTYNLGVNTLLQVGGNAFGSHFVRHGLGPNMNDKDKYINVVANNNRLAKGIEAGSPNRLLRLTHQFINGDSRELANYIGGPETFYGIGRTRILAPTNNLTGTPDTSISGFTPMPLQYISNIDEQGRYIVQDRTQSGNSIPQIFYLRDQDFRQFKNEILNAGLASSNYSKGPGGLNIESRIQLGNPGAPGRRVNYNKDQDPARQDLINKLSLFYSNTPPGKPSSIQDLNSAEIVDSAAVRDIIKFRIEAIDNDRADYSVWMVFRAFLTQWEYGFDTSWNDFRYTGRGEKFYVYEGGSSNVSLGFRIAAQSRPEMKALYQKINYLASNTMPDYSLANKMRGPVMKLTVGDLMYRQPGIITGLRYSLQMDYPWEIAISEPDGANSLDDDMHELPQIMDVSMTFIPIYNFLPRKSASIPYFGINNLESGKPQKDWLKDDKFVSLDSKINAARAGKL